MSTLPTQIAEHISSGKDISALANTLTSDSDVLVTAASASASVIAALDSFRLL